MKIEYLKPPTTLEDMVEFERVLRQSIADALGVPYEELLRVGKSQMTSVIRLTKETK